MNQNKTQNKTKTKEYVILILKITLVCGLLYFLACKGFISIQATREAFKQWDKLLPAMGVLIFSSFLGVVRWKWLLEAQSIHIDWVKTFQLTYIGNFFNIALPGAVSGDFVKAYYVGNETKGPKTRAFGSILFDRVAGVSALVFVSAGALVLGLSSYQGTPLFQAIQVLVSIAAGCVFLFYGYLFFVKEKHDPLLRFLRHLETYSSKFKSITHLYQSLRHYHQHPVAVIKVLLLSMLIHIMLGWACLNFSQALGEDHLTLLSILIVAPLGLLVTAVPVAPAGVGTGNIAFLYFFQLIGSQRGADIFSFVALTNILVGAFGGIVYFRFKGQGVRQLSGLPTPEPL